MDLNSLKETPAWDWPENAGEVLSTVLRDRGNTESDRRLAAELAGDLTVMDDQMADLLLSVVQNADETETLRAQAAISLGPALEEADTDGFEEDLDEVLAGPSITKVMFQRIQTTFRGIYSDERAPKEVRRRILEASVRAPQDWQTEAIRSAYSSDDEDWRLTAVFCMRWIRGFDAQILEMLENPNADIQCEAILAAGEWELDAAWPHVAALVASGRTEKPLLLAAIGAVASLRPQEANLALAKLADSEDDEIAEAVSEALLQLDFDEGDDWDKENDWDEAEDGDEAGDSRD